jgi:hypothetical protein
MALLVFTRLPWLTRLALLATGLRLRARRRSDLLEEFLWQFV